MGRCLEMVFKHKLVSAGVCKSGKHPTRPLIKDASK
jgi:hypothetical protein